MENRPQKRLAGGIAQMASGQRISNHESRNYLSRTAFPLHHRSLTTTKPQIFISWKPMSCEISGAFYTAAAMGAGREGYARL